MRATRPRVLGCHPTRCPRPCAPPRALGFSLGPSPADDDDAPPLFPAGGTGVRPPRPVAAALDSLLLFRSSIFEGDLDAPGVAAAAFLRSVAAPPSTRGDGSGVAAAAAALAVALTNRPGGAPTWREFLADAVVVGRNNPAAAAAARGSPLPPRCAAALTSDLRVLSTIAFTAAEAEGWASSARPRAVAGWAEALGGVVGGEEKEEEKNAAWPAPPPPRPTLHPPLTRGDRAARAAHLLSLPDWSAAADLLLATWTAHGAGNVGTFALFEWGKGRLSPAAEDDGGGEGVAPGGNTPAPWQPVAAAAAAWAAGGSAQAPFDGGAQSVLVDAAGSTTLWDALATDAPLLASGARLVRVPPGAAADWRGLARAARGHPRARWVAVCDGVGGDAEARAAVKGGVAPNVVLVATKAAQ